jgi:hypothetical protein
LITPLSFGDDLFVGIGGRRMNEDDLMLRNLTYAHFAELGGGPTAAEIATAAGRDRAEVFACWERLRRWEIGRD